MSLQSSANADCDDKQVREREVYVSVCMCVCVCVRVCVQQSVREKQTQIMTDYNIIYFLVVCLFTFWIYALSKKNTKLIKINKNGCVHSFIYLVDLFRLTNLFKSVRMINYSYCMLHA